MSSHPSRGGLSLHRLSSCYVCLCVALVILSSCRHSSERHTWDTVDSHITSTFPDIPQITTTELSTLLNNAPKQVMLLDARTTAEFAVSHLLGAVNVASTETAELLIASAPVNTTIVIYCSVGYRSAELISDLQRVATRTIYNLKGSIFRWANEDRPLYRGITRVGIVHPYDQSWGPLLKPARHAEITTR